MARIVKSITLTPWALKFILGALQRDAERSRDSMEGEKGAVRIAAMNCVSDAEHIASMFMGIVSPILDSVTITVSEKEGDHT